MPTLTGPNTFSHYADILWGLRRGAIAPDEQKYIITISTPGAAKVEVRDTEEDARQYAMEMVLSHQPCIVRVVLLTQRGDAPMAIQEVARYTPLQPEITTSYRSTTP